MFPKIERLRDIIMPGCACQQVCSQFQEIFSSSWQHPRTSLRVSAAEVSTTSESARFATSRRSRRLVQDPSCCAANLSETDTPYSSRNRAAPEAFLELVVRHCSGGSFHSVWLACTPFKARVSSEWQACRLRAAATFSTPSRLSSARPP